MSRDTRDTDYKPSGRQFKEMRHTPCRTRLREDKRVYTGYDSDSAISSIVGVSEDRVQLYVTDDTEDRTERHGKESMAKQGATQMESMLEMFLKMRNDDRKREERREREERERKDRRIEGEQEREEQHQQLIRQLKESQPAVPQNVHIQQTKLPTMNESDEVDVFVSQLEIALKLARIPRSRWKHNLLTQLTLTAKE